jgi:hypothetical protein
MKAFLYIGCVGAGVAFLWFLVSLFVARVASDEYKGRAYLCEQLKKLGVQQATLPPGMIDTAVELAILASLGYGKKGTRVSNEQFSRNLDFWSHVIRSGQQGGISQEDYASAWQTLTRAMISRIGRSPT